MYSFIKEQLINNNRDFQFLYSMLKTTNQLVDFDDYDLEKMKVISCSQQHPELTLDQVIDSEINYVEAGMTALYLSQILNESFTIHTGKQYFLRGYQSVYDCEHTWIETKDYILDPVLLFKIPLAYKDKFLYKTIKILTQQQVEQLNYTDQEYFLWMIRKLSNDSDYNQKLKDFLPRKNSNECLTYESNDIEGLFVKKYLLSNNSKFRNLYDQYKEQLKELEINIPTVSDLVCSEKNPNITLKYIFDKGLNIGNSGLISRFFGETITGDYKINAGTCSFLEGTYNASVGEHAWIETNDYIYDTTLMIKLPIALKDQFGYVTIDSIDKEYIRKDYREHDHIYAIDKREQLYEEVKELKYMVNGEKVKYVVG